MSEGKKVEVVTRFIDEPPGEEDWRESLIDSLLQLNDNVVTVKPETEGTTARWNKLVEIEEMLQWGRTYKITVEEVEEPA